MLCKCEQGCLSGKEIMWSVRTISYYDKCPFPLCLDFALLL